MCRVAALLLLVCALLPAPLGASGVEPARVGLRFVVAQVEGEPVASEAFLREQLARAHEIFAPLGIELVRLDDATMPAHHAELHTRRDRNALARYVQPGIISCMVVGKLMDVDEPGRERRGVHWTPPSARSKHFVIVSAISFPHVLAHELGHFFGNPSHSETPGNLMSYVGADGPPFLDDAQKHRVRRTLLRMLKRGELVAR